MTQDQCEQRRVQLLSHAQAGLLVAAINIVTRRGVFGSLLAAVGGKRWCNCKRCIWEGRFSHKRFLVELREQVVRQRGEHCSEVLLVVLFPQGLTGKSFSRDCQYQSRNAGRILQLWSAVGMCSGMAPRLSAALVLRGSVPFVGK
eukprot:3680491-Amphidinium_carterae.1